MTFNESNTVGTFSRRPGKGRRKREHGLGKLSLDSRDLAQRRFLSIH